MKSRGGIIGCVVGLDLSLTATAACALPMPWDGSVARIRTRIFGSKLTNDATPEQQAERRAAIADGVLAFCREVEATHVGYEEYAHNMSAQKNAAMTRELGGVVKDRLFVGWTVVPVAIVASSARKILLGVIPKQGKGQTKPYVVRNVKRLGAPVDGWTDDEIDAFVVANAMLERAGSTALFFQGE